MAKKGSKQELAKRHECVVAEAYGGYRSPSSGGAITDEGDVRIVGDSLIECKGKFGELASERPVRSTLLKQFEKIADESYMVGLEPGLALRFYAPESILSDKDGWVDLIVRLLDDDAHRVYMLNCFRDESCAEEGRPWH